MIVYVIFLRALRLKSFRVFLFSRDSRFLGNIYDNCNEAECWKKRD